MLSAILVVIASTLFVLTSPLNEIRSNTLTEFSVRQTIPELPRDLPRHLIIPIKDRDPKTDPYPSWEAYRNAMHDIPKDKSLFYSSLYEVIDGKSKRDQYIEKMGLSRLTRLSHRNTAIKHPAIPIWTGTKIGPIGSQKFSPRSLRAPYM